MLRLLLIFLIFSLSSLLLAEQEAQSPKPFLGVGLDGTRIIQVFEGSTAAALGLQENDVLKSWATSSDSPATEIDSLPTLQKLLQNSRVGDEIHLTVIRSKKELAFSGKLKARPEMPKPGIEGQLAPSWECSDWFQCDPDNPPKLENYKGKTVVLYCFQHW